ncbi:hypothetical protein ABTF49_19035, partial [Acinetobacter baumannii]
MSALPLAMAVGTLLAASWLIALQLERPELAARVWADDLQRLLPDAEHLAGGAGSWAKVLAW